MKNDVEGSFIPVKTYDFVLPPNFSPDDQQNFTTKLKIKKDNRAKPEITSQKSNKTQSVKEDLENDVFPEDEQPKSNKILLKKSESAQPISKPRPYSSKKNPISSDKGKTVQEHLEEDQQKQEAREFVSDWMSTADKKREFEIQKIEETTKFNRFDNKLSEEISELIKKIEYTRRHTASSIKNMRKTIKTSEPYQKEKLLLQMNPFKSFFTPSQRKEKTGSDKLELLALYSNEVVFKARRTDDIVSDDEDFVKNIKFDD